MLVYSGADILEIRPQQILESEIPIEHPYLALIKDPKPTKKRKYAKQTIKGDKTDGTDRQSDS